MSDECGSDGCDWKGDCGRGMSFDARDECVGGAHSTCGVSAADDVRVASVLRGMSSDCGVCVSV